MSDALIRDSFIAFHPLYEMARLRHFAIEDPANPRRSPVNRFSHARQLVDHTARQVTSPNNDTLYSSARLDLRGGPVVIATPAMPGRYHSLQFMNMHTDNLAILGTRTGDDGPLRVAVVPQGWTGALPAYTHRVEADTFDLWLLVRVLVDGPQDLPVVRGLQEAMSIEAPRTPELAQRMRPPREPEPVHFVAVVSEFLARNPPRGPMRLAAQAAQAVGIGPQALAGMAQAGLSAVLPADLRARWERAWPALCAELRGPLPGHSRRVGVWHYLPDEVGRWGDNLALRAAISVRGIAALDADEALYLECDRDDRGHALDGRIGYRIMLPAAGLPVRAFWSLSLYERLPDGRSFFVENPIRRYALGDRSPDLRRESDGSIVLQVQRESPADQRNWLPAPAGPMRLWLRAYLPLPALIEGRAELPTVRALTPG